MEQVVGEPSHSNLDDLSDQYETAEAQFLSLVRSHAERSQLADAAAVVAAAAGAWNSEAYRQFHKTPPGDSHDNLDWLTERTEVLSELWPDLTAAYRV